jgi:hypothetical protein
MNIQQSEIQREISAVLADTAKSVTAKWDVTIHANGKDYVPLYVDLVETEHNFMAKWHSVQTVEVVLTLAQVEYHIIPNRSRLELTLTRTPMIEGPNPTIDPSASKSSFRYVAKLYDNTSELLTGTNPALGTEEVADRAMLKKIRIQLVNPHLDHLLKQTVGGMFRQISGVNLARLLLVEYSRTDIKDSATYIKGAQLAPNYSDKIMEHIEIPHLTPVVDVPDVIHRNCGGIYPAGFKWYLWGQHWYLFSPYDVKAYEKSKRTLTVVNVPANRLADVDRTYRVTDSQVIVLATGDMTHTDHSEQDQLNIGNGVRFINAELVTEGFMTIADNKATVDKSKTANEFIIAERPDGLNKISESPRRLTSAMYLEYGELAERLGFVVSVAWEHSNHLLLYPGMPVKFMYTQNNVAEQLFGILLGCHTFHMPTTANVKAKKLVAKTALTIFLQRDIAMSNATV